MLQHCDTMTAISFCLILVIVTVHTSLARVFTQCELLSELRRQGVPENDLATCEYNSYKCSSIYFAGNINILLKFPQVMFP
jgi:hypothetical protein